MIVPPHSRRGETAAVLAATLLIAAAGLASIRLRRAPEGQVKLPDYQVPLPRLEGRDQGLCRELMAAYEEAALLREELGRWPRAEELRAAGVTPFAAGPADRARGIYDWTESFRAGDAWQAKYFGLPRQAGRPAVLLSIWPEPSVPPGGRPPLLTDGEHYALPGGGYAHAQVWMIEMKPGLTIPKMGPDLLGWKRVLFR